MHEGSYKYRNPIRVAAGVVAGEATRVGTTGDDGETGKEPDDHSRDGGVCTGAASSPPHLNQDLHPLNPNPRHLNPLSRHPNLNSYPQCPLEALMYLDTSFVWEGSEMMMVMVSRKRIYTSYERNMGTKQMTLLFGMTCPGIGSAGAVESDEAEECDEVILVSDGSKSSNSSSVRGD
nr:hypothetical protein [Tanacetum cinerariifolium]